MIASCPSCVTRFEVDEAKLRPAGRKVKCGKCGHLWLQRPDGTTAEVAEAATAAAPPIDIPAATTPGSNASIIEQTGERAAAEAAAEPDPATSPSAEPEVAKAPRVVPPPKRRSGKRLVAMLLLVIVTLGLLGLGAMALRSGDLQKTPLVASILGAVGLAANEQDTEGLGFENVSTARRSEGTVQLLVVSGDVVNTAAIAKIIPPLRGALLAADNREVQNWTFAAKAEKVEPGQRVKFETTLRSPSMDATDVKVTFAIPGG